MFSKTLKKISIYCIASIGMCVVYTCILFIWSTSDKEKKVFSGAIHNLRHQLSRGRVDLPKGDVTTYVNLFSKNGDKGEGGVKHIKKWVTSFMDGP